MSAPNILCVLDEKIKTLDEKITTLIKETGELREPYMIMTNTDGVGKVVATTLLALMPELGELTRRQAASLAGCAPHPKDSGKMHGYRCMRGGRHQIKRVLGIAKLYSPIQW